MLSIFGATSDGITAILMTVSGLIAGAVVWLAGYFNSKHERKRKELKEDEKTIIDHLKEVEARCNEENKELKQDIKYTNRRLLKVINHMMYLEGILESSGIKFRRINMEEELLDGTDTHHTNHHEEAKTNVSVSKTPSNNAPVSGTIRINPSTGGDK